MEINSCVGGGRLSVYYTYFKVWVLRFMFKWRKFMFHLSSCVRLSFILLRIWFMFASMSSACILLMSYMINISSTYLVWNIMFLESKSCFMHCSSRCCKNISAIVLGIDVPMVMPFFGWCTLLWKAKCLCHSVILRSSIICWVTFRLLFFRSSALVICSVSCMCMLMNKPCTSNVISLWFSLMWTSTRSVARSVEFVTL
jgi:hypothetical protein